MADPNDLTDAIVKAASGIQSATIDGNTVVSQDPTKLAEADRYLASKAAVRQRHRGVRFSRVISPGTCNPHGTI